MYWRKNSIVFKIIISKVVIYHIYISRLLLGCLITSTYSKFPPFEGDKLNQQRGVKYNITYSLVTLPPFFGGEIKSGSYLHTYSRFHKTRSNFNFLGKTHTHYTNRYSLKDIKYQRQN